MAIAVASALSLLVACDGGPQSALGVSDLTGPRVPYPPPGPELECRGFPATVRGTDGHDVLRGTDEPDVIVGLNGDDTIEALGGDDVVCAGRGADRVVGSSGFDLVNGGDGDDRCDLGEGSGDREGCEDPTILAAGDIACSPSEAATESQNDVCGEASTAEILTRPWPNLGAVLMLGDAQYQIGDPKAFAGSYDRTWGQVEQLTYPVPGDNDYGTPDAAGFFDYFADRPGDGLGYYSFDVHGWHLVALNSNCWQVGGCGADDPQAEWLHRDLAASDATCTLAFLHHPRFSSSAARPNDSVLPIWRELYEAGADVVLSGHNHNYERFEPVDPSGRPDARGLTEFIVGTGGYNLHAFESILPTSQARNAEAFGVLELTLRPAAYEWRFLPVQGEHYTDGGEASCV